jgi:hypothetical protein
MMLSQIGQIGGPVSDVDRSEAFDLWMAFFNDPDAGADAGGAQGIHAADMMLGSLSPET